MPIHFLWEIGVIVFLIFSGMGTGGMGTGGSVFSWILYLCTY